jgi:SPP1 family predicted phage head-tail adaptor
VNGFTAIALGQLRHNVRIEQRSGSPDASGQPSRSWSLVVATRAALSQLSGRRLELAKAVNAEATHEVVMRYRSGITPAMRLVYQSRAFTVLSIDDEGMRHRKLVLLCSEVLG